jgi:hypothetical protein
MSKRLKKFQQDLQALRNRAKQQKQHHKSKDEVRGSMTPEEYLLMRAEKFRARGEDWNPMVRKMMRLADEVMDLRKANKLLVREKADLLQKLNDSKEIKIVQVEKV